MGIFHAQFAALHAQHPVAGVAELEDVAGHAFDGEVFVHAADRDGFRFHHHRVVGGVGYGAAGGERGQARAALALDPAVHGVAMHQACAWSASRAVSFHQHAQHGIELLARKVTIRPGPAQPIEQGTFIPFTAGHLGHDLLGQNIARCTRNLQGIHLAAADAVEQGHALDQIIARLRKQAALGRGVHRVAGTPHALQEGGNCAR